MIRRVLIADDDPDIRLMLGSILRVRGWSVTEAPDGHDAVTAAFQDPFDLIVLDHAMPRMTGVEAARNMRLFYRGPIIFYTAHMTEVLEEEVRASVPGEVYLISKTDFNGFLTVIEQLAAA